MIPRLTKDDWFILPCPSWWDGSGAPVGSARRDCAACWNPRSLVTSAERRGWATRTATIRVAWSGHSSSGPVRTDDRLTGAFPQPRFRLGGGEG